MCYCNVGETNAEGLVRSKREISFGCRMLWTEASIYSAVRADFLSFYSRNYFGILYHIGSEFLASRIMATGWLLIFTFIEVSHFKSIWIFFINSSWITFFFNFWLKFFFEYFIIEEKTNDCRIAAKNYNLLRIYLYFLLKRILVYLYFLKKRKWYRYLIWPFLMSTVLVWLRMQSLKINCVNKFSIKRHDF